MLSTIAICNDKTKYKGFIMGAWGHGVIENDNAYDVIGTISDVTGIKFENILSTISSDNPVLKENLVKHLTEENIEKIKREIGNYEGYKFPFMAILINIGMNHPTLKGEVSFEQIL